MSTTITRPAHAASATTGSAHGVSFALALDAAAYAAAADRPATLTATMILRAGTTASPLSLTFAGGQQFDLSLTDATGREVALWSAGRMFDDMVQTVTVHGEHRWEATMAVPPPAAGDDPMAVSALTATAWLTPAPAAVPPHPPVMQPDTMPRPIGTPVLPFPPADGRPERTWSASVGVLVHTDPVVLDAPRG